MTSRAVAVLNTHDQDPEGMPRPGFRRARGRVLVSVEALSGPVGPSGGLARTARQRRPQQAQACGTPRRPRRGRSGTPEAARP